MEHKKLLLQITDLKKYFPVKKTTLFQKEHLWIKANDGISINIYEGETFGLVGESGCGKSTLGRILLQLYQQTEGTIRYYGRSRRQFCPRYVEHYIQNLEMILHNPKKRDKEYDSLVRIFGGLILASDLREVANAFHEEYRAWQKRSRMNTAISPEEKSLSTCAARIDALRAKYNNDERFLELEAMQDDSIDLSMLTRNEMRILRKDLQIIFQDPYSSLNPRMTAGHIIEESLFAHGLYRKNSDEMRSYVEQIMEECGLAPYMAYRYPHQFSGGQRQRICIARALALRPQFVVCDEAVSALDVSIQSQIINLLLDLKEQSNLTYLFISHDLSVVKHISDRIAVMYLGSIVELAPTADIFSSPRHPYTQALLSAIPTTDLDDKKESILLEGDIPSPVNPPKGCRFHTRCRFADDICCTKQPAWQEVTAGHYVACHKKDTLSCEGKVW